MPNKAMTQGWGTRFQNQACHMVSAAWAIWIQIASFISTLFILLAIHVCQGEICICLHQEHLNLCQPLGGRGKKRNVWKSWKKRRVYFTEVRRRWYWCDTRENKSHIYTGVLGSFWGIMRILFCVSSALQELWQLYQITEETQPACWLKMSYHGKSTKTQQTHRTEGL